MTSAHGVPCVTLRSKWLVACIWVQLAFAKEPVRYKVLKGGYMAMKAPFWALATAAAQISETGPPFKPTPLPTFTGSPPTPEQQEDRSALERAEGQHPLPMALCVV